MFRENIVRIDNINNYSDKTKKYKNVNKLKLLLEDIQLGAAILCHKNRFKIDFYCNKLTFYRIKVNEK